MMLTLSLAWAAMAPTGATAPSTPSVASVPRKIMMVSDCDSNTPFLDLIIKFDAQVARALAYNMIRGNVRCAAHRSFAAHFDDMMAEVRRLVESHQVPAHGGDERRV